MRLLEPATLQQHQLAIFISTGLDIAIPSSTAILHLSITQPSDLCALSTATATDHFRSRALASVLQLHQRSRVAAIAGLVCIISSPPVCPNQSQSQWRRKRPGDLLQSSHARPPFKSPRTRTWPAAVSLMLPRHCLRISRISQVTRHLATAPASIHSAPILSSRSRPHLGGIAAMASAAERQRRTIQTAACLIIGDEVLGGKTVDTNSTYMAKWCFQLGLRLKKIEVVEDDEADIIDAVRRLSTTYDFVWWYRTYVGSLHSRHLRFSSNQPSHDDITYQAIAKAFDLPLKIHDEAFKRMKLLAKPHPSQPKFNWDEDSPDLRAKMRMVHLPTDESRPLTDQFLFTSEELWVPVSVVNGNVHILPGIPRLCKPSRIENCKDGIKPHILSRLVDPEGKGSHRVVIQTPYSESKVAGYLTDLAGRVEPKGVKVGSYPHWGRKYNTVTLVGKDHAFLESLVDEVVKNIEGKRVYQQEDIEGGPPNESKV
ncbi:hypothetical protein G3M48_005784 [Beauveria asiatica]|uniref:MoaB/Mog domain-containing protein n=1 Tax=Beauveria asiatica TaxID=1069075 RepID=A0AAW0RQE7_9HYPO